MSGKAAGIFIPQGSIAAAEFENLLPFIKGTLLKKPGKPSLGIFGKMLVQLDAGGDI